MAKWLLKTLLERSLPKQMMCGRETLKGARTELVPSPTTKLICLRARKLKHAPSLKREKEREIKKVDKLGYICYHIVLGRFP